MISQVGLFTRELADKLEAEGSGNHYRFCDTPEKKDLLASYMSKEEIRQFIGADNLQYLSLNSLYLAITKTARNNKNPQYCDACFSNQYPITLTDHEQL
jgi:glutamine phosphoribosylpyrophosphate amidotransferase